MSKIMAYRTAVESYI